MFSDSNSGSISAPPAFFVYSTTPSAGAQGVGAAPSCARRGPATGSSAARGSALTINLRSDQGIAPYARLHPFRARSAEHPDAREACDDPSSACSAFLRFADSFRFRRAMPGATGKDPSTRPAGSRSHDSVGEGLAPSRRYPSACVIRGAMRASRPTRGVRPAPIHTDTRRTTPSVIRLA